MFQFPGLPPGPYAFRAGRAGMAPLGFPHSDTRGSMGACPSPRIIAACRVLHRLPVPRHPPCALDIFARGGCPPPPRPSRVILLVSFRSFGDWRGGGSPRAVGIVHLRDRRVIRTTSRRPSPRAPGGGPALEISVGDFDDHMSCRYAAAKVPGRRVVPGALRGGRCERGRCPRSRKLSLERR